MKNYAGFWEGFDEVVMTMPCTKAKKYIPEAVERSLAPELQKAVEGHVMQCPSCLEQWGSDAKTVALLRKAPVHEVPDWVWTRIVGETANLPVGAPAQKSAVGWADWLKEMSEDLSWGRKVAFSSVLAGLLALFVVWGSFVVRSPGALPVVNLPGSAVSAFPSYVREHYNPAGQPISEGPMVLAFNTMGDALEEG